MSISEGPCGIYALVAPSGNMYIGSSQTIRKRTRWHDSQLKMGIHKNVGLTRAFKKYGELSIKILLVCRKQDLMMYEQLCIDGLKPAYNSSKIAGRVEFTQDVRAKLSAAQRGKKATPEARAKLAKALKGNKNRLGVPHRPEIKAHLAAVLKLATHRRDPLTGRFA